MVASKSRLPDGDVPRQELLELQSEYLIAIDNETGEIAYSTPPPYPDFTQIPGVCIIFIVIYIVVMGLALFGNAIVIYTVFTNRKMQTVVNYYIVNLAVCDFLVGGFVLPVKLLELTAPASWGMLSDGLCTTMLYLQTVFVFASVLTLVATCLERYFAILHPLESRMQQSKARSLRILLLVWVSPCVAASPFLYPSKAYSDTLSSDYGTISRLTCYITFDPQFRKVYYAFLFCFFYLLPLIFIGGTCFRIAKCLLQGISFHRQGSLRRQEANRRKVAKMVMVVALAFAISWTPYFIVSIVTQINSLNFLEKENFFFTMLCINLFAFLNSSVNPFIYAAMSTRFRNGFRRFFRALFCLHAAAAFPPGSKQGRKNRMGRDFCFSYHRQMVLVCGDPSQLSTESGSQSDSVQHTALALGSFRTWRGFLESMYNRKKMLSKTVSHNGGLHILGDRLLQDSIRRKIVNGIPPPTSIMRKKSCSMSLLPQLTKLLEEQEAAEHNESGLTRTHSAVTIGPSCSKDATSKAATQRASSSADDLRTVQAANTKYSEEDVEFKPSRKFTSSLSAHSVHCASRDSKLIYLPCGTKSSECPAKLKTKNISAHNIEDLFPPRTVSRKATLCVFDANSDISEHRNPTWLHRSTSAPLVG